MRRSAAPSLRADIKRARFLPQLMRNLPLVGKENEHSSDTPKEINNSADIPSTVIDKVNKNLEFSEKIRSNKDVLDIIFEADSTVSEVRDSGISFSKENNILDVTEKNIQPPLNTNRPVVVSHSNINKGLNEKLSNCIFCIKDIEEATLFNVVWCKRSGKKHKTWEGDGLLIVKSHSAVLKDINGKILDKGVGYKLKETESLEEGSKFFIGGKECEIQCKISDEECQSGKYCKCNLSANVSIQSPVRKPEIKVVPVPTHKPC